MIDEYELNSDGLTESWGFPSLADSTSQQAGLIYGIEQRDVSAPYIDNGLAIIPPPGGGGTTLTGVEYSSTATVPGINGTVIVHPYADDSKSGGGVIKSIKASSVDAPYIDSGEIVIPEAPTIPTTEITIVQELETVPEPGEDGWVETLYLPMLSWNGGSDIASFRQLMKATGTEIKVSSQLLLFRPGEVTNWEVLFES